MVPVPVTCRCRRVELTVCSAHPSTPERYTCSPLGAGDHTEGQLPPTPGPGPAAVAWTHFRGLAQAGLASVRPMLSRGGADALSGGPLLLQALPVSQLLRSKPSGGPSANPPWPSQPRPVLTCSPLDYRETEHHPQSTAASESCLENPEQMNSCAGKVEMNFTTQRLWAQPETTYCKFQTASKF